MCECELRMKILLIFTLCLISDEKDCKKEKDIFTLMELKVPEQGDLNISYQYPESLMRDPTCRSLQTAYCYIKESENVNLGKISLSYDTKGLRMEVIIRNLTKRDSGEYWCEASGQSGKESKVYFTQINLTVTEPCGSVKSVKTTQPPPSSTSPPAEFPASILITVSVIPLLLLIALIFLIVILQRRCRVKGMASLVKCCVSGNNQEENDENKDTRRLCASDVDIFTISPAQQPTPTSDASQNVYDNTLLPTSPCVSTVYPNAEFPTIPSDQDISATAQLPTDLPASSVSAAQQSGGESVKGPVYAAVRFSTKATSSSSTVPKIIIDKEEISCDNESQP